MADMDRTSVHGPHHAGVTHGSSRLCSDREFGRFQRQREHLIHRPDNMELHLVAHVRWNVIEIGLVALGHDHLSETRSVSGQHVLLQTGRAWA